MAVSESHLDTCPHCHKPLVCSNCGEPIAAPFKYWVGDRLRVTRKDKGFGMVGTVEREGKIAKAKMPPPPPENYYWLRCEDGKLRAFREDDLEPI